jgi:hypothetical protein
MRTMIVFVMMMPPGDRAEDVQPGETATAVSRRPRCVTHAARNATFQSEGLT